MEKLSRKTSAANSNDCMASQEIKDTLSKALYGLGDRLLLFLGNETRSELKIRCALCTVFSMRGPATAVCGQRGHRNHSH